MKSVLPGMCIGILGGGQLARMTTLAAHAMGCRVHVYDPAPYSPAREAANLFFSKPWQDLKSVAEFARSCDVVTVDLENIPAETLQCCAAFAPVRPDPQIIEMVQSKARQKSWLKQTDVPVGPYAEATNLLQLAEALSHFGPSFVKASVGGYDGRGQMPARGSQDAGEVWRALGERPCIVEQKVDLACEISVLVARRPSGQIVSYPPALNHHERQILKWSALPAAIPENVRTQAQLLAERIAMELEISGLLVVEMFVTNEGALLVNELAPRPHNSYHASERACVTSQFEQLVRAVCDLPLGDPSILAPTAIVNLLGDLWLGAEPPNFSTAMEDPGVRVHLYGKSETRRGRKMGHLSCIGNKPADAVGRVLRAHERLCESRRPRPVDHDPTCDERSAIAY